MSERWGVRAFDMNAKIDRRLVTNDGKPWSGTWGEAQRIVDYSPGYVSYARVVRLVPRRNASAQRRVFEGIFRDDYLIVDKFDKVRRIEYAILDGKLEGTTSDDWFQHVPCGKRLRVTVELLPDGATDAKGGVPK